jgi:hypothetical protein
MKLWDDIISTRNVERMFALDDRAFSVVLNQMTLQENGEDLDDVGGYKPVGLTPAKSVIFLCHGFQNLLEAEGFGGFFQYQIAFAADVVRAFEAIGAINIAKLINQAMILSPSEDSYFNATKAVKDELNNIESKIGNCCEYAGLDALVKKHAESNRHDFQ